MNVRGWFNNDNIWLAFVYLYAIYIGKPNLISNMNDTT